MFCFVIILIVVAISVNYLPSYYDNVFKSASFKADTLDTGETERNILSTQEVLCVHLRIKWNCCKCFSKFTKYKV